MSRRVQDYNGKEIVVGTMAMYGEEHKVEVIEITEPDIYSHDDDYGREIVDGYMLEIVVQFGDGSTDRLRARDVTIRLGPPEYWDDNEIFEEPGDLAVVS